MFTAKGNRAVADLVARAYNKDDALQRLEFLAKKPGMREATDTMVREKVAYHFSPRETHTGTRLTVSGRCEKCDTKTNWVVDVMGRSAYWCGCGN